MTQNDLIIQGFLEQQNHIIAHYPNANPAAVFDVGSGLITSGLGSESYSALTLLGFNATVNSLYKLIIEFDSKFHMVEEFDSPLIEKDHIKTKIKRKYHMWV